MTRARRPDSKLLISQSVRFLVVSLVALAVLGCNRGGESDTSPSTRFSKFEDISQETGIDFEHDNGWDGVNWRVVETVNGGVALLDYDNDGWLDVYFTNGRKIDAGPNPPRNALYRNRGQGRFEETSKAAGVDDSALSLGCTVADIDGDGDSDLYLTNDGPNRLYRNNGNGTFTDIAARAGVASASQDSGCVFFDMDKDGDLDLYVGGYCVDKKKDQAPALSRGVPSYWPPLNYEGVPDQLFRNEGNGVFVDVSKTSGILDVEPSRALGVIATDFNCDGNMDIYVANDRTANFMFLGDGHGHFIEEGFMNGAALCEQGKGMGSMGLHVGDFDGDGRGDLVVTNYDRETPNLYWTPDREQYEERAHIAGITLGTLRAVSWGVGFMDLDLDGWQDLYVANGHLNPKVHEMDEGMSYGQKNRIFRNLGTGKFEDVGSQAGEALAIRQVSRGVAFGDLDNDGDIDIVVLNAHGPPQVLRNQPPSKRNWALVRLMGDGLNRDAIGAQVTLKFGQRSVWRERCSAESFLSVNDPRLHFGLGSARVIDQLEIRWPDGQVQKHERLPVNSLLTLQRGRKEVGVAKF